MEQTINNFAVYEDDTNFIGMAEATLPDLDSIKDEIQGAGLMGKIEIPIIGQFEAMTLGLTFRTHTAEAVTLCEQRYHTIQLYEAVQQTNDTSGELEIKQTRHVFKVMPKTYKAGTVAPATSASASGEYAVHYWAEYVDGEKVLEIDPVGRKCYINGTDYYADVRTALGM
ncbi:MAG: phage major tail tube protein [Oscillospiraceae bacterium]|nr:phage major tail tube protein [Oscillospiraceae bacterium]